jgi:hypothetical protein
VDASRATNSVAMHAAIGMQVYGLKPTAWHEGTCMFVPT